MKSQEKPPLFRFIFQFIAETLLSEEMGEWLTVNQMVQIVLDNDPDIKECTIRWAIGRAFQQALFVRRRPESHLKGKPFYYSLTTKGVNYYDWILGQYLQGVSREQRGRRLEKEFRNMEYRYLVYSIDKHQA